MASSSNFLKSSIKKCVVDSKLSSPNRGHSIGLVGSENNSSIIISIVSFRGILVNRETTSKLARNFPETSNSQISLAKSKEEMAVYSFFVIGLIIGTRYLAIL